MNVRRVGGILAALALALLPMVAVVHAQTNNVVAGNEGQLPNCNISVNPDTITRGGNTLLTWNQTGFSTSGYITPGIGPVATSGRLVISPQVTTKFEGTFRGRLGTTTCAITVTVYASNSTGINSSGYITGRPVVGTSPSPRVTCTPPATLMTSETGAVGPGWYCLRPLANISEAPTGTLVQAQPPGMVVPPATVPADCVLENSSNIVNCVYFYNPSIGATCPEGTTPSPSTNSCQLPNGTPAPVINPPSTIASPSTQGGATIGGPTTGNTGTSNSGDTTSGSINPGALVSCRGLECNLCEFVKTLNRIINFLLGLTVPLAMGLFAWAGILYYTSAASEENIKKAKGIFRNTLVGFLIAISGWLIVQTTINVLAGNKFTNWKWNEVTCSGDRIGVDKKITISKWIEGVLPKLSSIIGVTTITQTSGVQTTTVGGRTVSCANCVPIPSDFPDYNRALSCSQQVNGVCQVDASLIAPLTALKQNLQKQDVGWYISEAWPPTVIHQSAAQNAGNSVDISACNAATGIVGSDAIASCLSTFQSATANTGLQAVYEVKTPEQAAAILAAARDRPMPTIIVVPTINGSHFSIYKGGN